jgi:hypothetical protein
MRSYLAVFLGFFFTACLIFTGCASHKSSPASSSQSKAQSAGNTSPTGPDAKINISYSRPGDFLKSLTVTEYDAAQTILTESSKGHLASIIRFDGGIVIWEVGVKEKLLADVPLLGESKLDAVSQVVYGKLPPNFVATIPDNGPPQPLQADHYYIFTVVRASGVTSYEAVKVNGDGSLEGYTAEPRAGDSFRVCCEVAADFVVNANAMTTTAPGTP